MKNKDLKLPGINPYIFTLLLAAFGLWCFYDGWINKNPEMLKHLWFNRTLSLILLPWSIFDFFNVKKKYYPSKKE